MRKLVRTTWCAAVLASPAVLADVTGNAGAFSTYMFRGVTQSAGDASVQGGVDMTTPGGLYAGVWVAGTDEGFTGSSYETDVYGGWTGNGLDVGAIFYGYRDTGSNNFAEVYAGVSMQGFTAKVYFSPEFAATDESALYGTLSYAIALDPTLMLTPQIGLSTGDAWEEILAGANPAEDDDGYVDYSLTLTKALKDDFTVSLGYVANTLDEDDYGSVLGENGQAVVGIKKTFGL